MRAIIQRVVTRWEVWRAKLQLHLGILYLKTHPQTAGRIITMWRWQASQCPDEELRSIMLNKIDSVQLSIWPVKKART